VKLVGALAAVFVVMGESIAHAGERNPLPRHLGFAHQTDFQRFGAGMDIGVETASHFSKALDDARTIIWNGPMGVFEEPPFNEGTLAIARAVAEAADRGAIVIVGGGDSVSAITQAGVADRITHISTGGGATLEFLAGEELPGVAALGDK